MSKVVLYTPLVTGWYYDIVWENDTNLSQVSLYIALVLENRTTELSGRVAPFCTVFNAAVREGTNIIFAGG